MNKEAKKCLRGYVGKTKTDEELKTKIFKYLDHAVKKRSWKIEDFTLVSISKNINMEEERVKKILEELSEEEKELIKVIKIETDVYLPTEGSEKIEKSLRAKKLTVPVSPYVGFIITIVALIFLVSYLMINASAKDALILALFTGPIVAYSIQIISKEFMRWKVTSEKKYEDMSKLSKFSTYLIAILVSILICYYAFGRLTQTEMKPEIIAVIVGAFSTPVIARAAYIIWKWS